MRRRAFNVSSIPGAHGEGRFFFFLHIYNLAFGSSSVVVSLISTRHQTASLSPCIPFLGMDREVVLKKTTDDTYYKFNAVFLRINKALFFLFRFGISHIYLYQNGPPGRLFNAYFPFPFFQTVLHTPFFPTTIPLLPIPSLADAES